MKQIYTDDEQIIRVTAIESIKDLMSRRAVYLANDWRRRELDELWVTGEEYRKTASFGGNWGYYVGMDEIAAWYVVEHDRKRKEQLSWSQKRHPELTGALSELGFGCIRLQPVSSPYVELAGDGKSARGLWYSMGMSGEVQPDGSSLAMWVNDKLAADLILEEDGWKIWHLVVANDTSCPSGDVYAKIPPYPSPADDPILTEFGTPTISMQTHNPVFLWSDDYPSIPKPYYRITKEDSYGPEGHPDYKEANGA